MRKVNKNQDYRVGFILSAGGSAFEKSVKLSGLSPNKFYVISDRNCDALTKASYLGIAYEKIPFKNHLDFSLKAHNAFLKSGCNIIILHFSRLVTSELFKNLLTINVHPSILPAFPGLDAVGDAAKENSLMQGATLHLVDSGIDTGPIIAQSIASVPNGASLEWRHSLAYRQKVLVTLCLLDWLENGLVDLTQKKISAFRSTRDFTGNILFSQNFNELARKIFFNKVSISMAIT